MVQDVEFFRPRGNEAKRPSGEEKNLANLTKSQTWWSPKSDLELFGALVEQLLEGLWDTLRRLLEDLQGVLESLGNVLRSLDESGGTLWAI